MLRRLVVVAALAMLLFPAASRAQELNQGEWLMTLSGQAANGPDFDGFFGSVAVGLTHMLTDQLEVGVRESVFYDDRGGGGSNLGVSSRVVLDYNFDMGQWYPFVGGNIGFLCGDLVDEDTWTLAPEAGVKYFVNPDTFIFAMVEYQFFCNEGEELEDSFSDGQFVYTLGVGFTF